MESGTQMTFAELGLMMSLPQNVIVSDFLANLSAYLDTDEVLKTQGALYSLRLCELLKKDSLNTYSLKMSQGCLTIVGGNIHNNYYHNGTVGVFCRMASA